MGDEVVKGQIQVVAAAIGAIVLLLVVTSLLTQKVLTPYLGNEVAVAGADAYDLAHEVASALGTPEFNSTITNLLINYCVNVTILNFTLVNGSLVNKLSYVSECGSYVAGVATAYAVVNDSLYVVRVEVMGS